MDKVNLKPIALYRCLKCSFEWKDLCGMVGCPVCGHIYIKWLNYEENRKNNFKK